MATRASIGLDNGDHTVTSIYLHHDGYIEGAGEILKANYDTPVAVETLLELGNLSDLASDTEQCEAYGRDWNRDGEEAQRHSINNWPIDTAYFYLYRRVGEGNTGAWWVSTDASHWSPLAATEVIA